MTSRRMSMTACAQAVLAGLLILALPGCGNDNFSRTSEQTPPQKAPTLMASFSGWNSCATHADGNPAPWGTRFFQAAESARAAAHGRVPDLTIEWFASCFDADGQVWYVSSRRPAVHVADADDVAVIVGGLLRETGAGNLQIAGHSFGGWLAMKAALALGDETRLDATYTIDPISAKMCWFDSPTNCVMAPPDIGVLDRLRIARVSDVWKNFYQTQTMYLHSSAISQADANLELAASHTQIDTHEMVWRFFTNDLIRFASPEAE